MLRLPHKERCYERLRISNWLAIAQSNHAYAHRILNLNEVAMLIHVSHDPFFELLGEEREWGEEEKEGGGESDSDGGNAGAGAGVAGAAAAEGRRGRRRARASAGIRSGKQLLQEIRKIVKSIDRSLPQQVRCINMIE